MDLGRQQLEAQTARGPITATLAAATAQAACRGIAGPDVGPPQFAGPLVARTYSAHSGTPLPHAHQRPRPRPQSARTRPAGIPRDPAREPASLTAGNTRGFLPALALPSRTAPNSEILRISATGTFITRTQVHSDRTGAPSPSAEVAVGPHQIPPRTAVRAPSGHPVSAVSCRPAHADPRRIGRHSANTPVRSQLPEGHAPASGDIRCQTPTNTWPKPTTTKGTEK